MKYTNAVSIWFFILKKHTKKNKTGSLPGKLNVHQWNEMAFTHNLVYIGIGLVLSLEFVFSYLGLIGLVLIHNKAS